MKKVTKWQPCIIDSFHKNQKTVCMLSTFEQFWLIFLFPNKNPWVFETLRDFTWPISKNCDFPWLSGFSVTGRHPVFRCHTPGSPAVGKTNKKWICSTQSDTSNPSPPKDRYSNLQTKALLLSSHNLKTGIIVQSISKEKKTKGDSLGSTTTSDSESEGNTNRNKVKISENDSLDPNPDNMLLEHLTTALSVLDADEEHRKLLIFQKTLSNSSGNVKNPNLHPE